MKTEIFINGNDLTIDTVAIVARDQEKKFKLSIDPDALIHIKKSRAYVDALVEKGKPVYGINTGFGALSNEFIPKEKLEELQYNLIRSHCTGVGAPFSKDIVRAVMLLRANCLSPGFSGVTPYAIELLLEFINHHITPVVPQKGSVGASGDLAPLSHIALALIGEGEVEYEGKILNSAFVIDQIGLKPLQLKPKDGLALINGTAVMAALGCLAVYDTKNILKVADIAAASTLDGVQGTSMAYHPAISKLKPHPGQLDACENLNTLLKDSEILHSHENCGKVQDPYSLRCVPQVHGACRQTLIHAEHVVQTEINCVTDNPLIFPEDDLVISGGNFHGEALALCMDYLAMGVAEICSISERRIEKMMNPTFSDLPAFLIESSGLNSGLMIAQVTAAALTSENKHLCHPASIDSIPTSTDKEDHVSMGVTSGRKLVEVITNTTLTLAIEFLCNSQALDFRAPKKSSPALDKVHKLIRKHVPHIDKDRIFHKDIDNLYQLIKSQEIKNTVESVLGELK